MRNIDLKNMQMKNIDMRNSGMINSDIKDTAIKSARKISQNPHQNPAKACAKIFLLLATFCSLHTALHAQSTQESPMIKSGSYKAIGITTGYYYYGEVDRLGDEVMHVDLNPMGIYGNLGYVFSHGLRLDFWLDINSALGTYTGGILDTANAERDGKPVKSIFGNMFFDSKLRAGYDLLAFTERASAYLQSGVGYYFNWSNVLINPRLQGYLYIPLELEGQIALGRRWSLDYKGGYNLFLLGNHLTNGTGSGYSGSLDTLQKRGFGASGKIGASFVSAQGFVNRFGASYDYWSIEASDPATLTDYSGSIVRLYEPKNTTHIIRLYYEFVF